MLCVLNLTKIFLHPSAKKNTKRFQISHFQWLILSDIKCHHDSEWVNISNDEMTVYKIQIMIKLAKTIKPT